MLPNVINNIVEASVSVGRVQTFLMETEKVEVPSSPLTQIGISMFCASCAWEKTSWLQSKSEKTSDKNDTTLATASSNSYQNVTERISSFIFRH